MAHGDDVLLWVDDFQKKKEKKEKKEEKRRTEKAGVNKICCCLVAQLTLLQSHGLEPTRFLRPWDFPVRNIGVGCHFLLQGNLPNPGIKPAAPASIGRQILYH